MRDGNGVLFYWPVVVRPDGVMQPLPSGEIVSLSKTDPVNITMNLSEDGDNEFYNTEGPDGGVSNVVIDPRAIPIAIERPYLEGETYLRDHVNRLEIKHFGGLFVGSYYNSDNKPLYNGPSTVHTETGAFEQLENLVVTVKDLADKLRDCDGKAIVNANTFTEFPSLSLATCANLEAMKQEIRSLISEVRQTLVDMQNQLQQEIDSKFDGSNATPDIKDDLDNAGTSSTSDYEPKPMRVLAAECRHGRDSDVTRYYAVAAGLTPDTTYAIDQYIANPLRAEPSYLGTHYVQSNSSGQVSRHVRMYHGGNFGDEPRFVLRTLRADESHRQGQGAPYQGQCSF